MQTFETGLSNLFFQCTTKTTSRKKMHLLTVLYTILVLHNLFNTISHLLLPLNSVDLLVTSETKK